MNKPTAMLLEANFDINQVGETLEWKFSRWDGQGNPVQGRYAGEIYFTIGEEVKVRIEAGSYQEFTGFEVLDCCLITRPQIVSIAPAQPAIYAQPSPFLDTDGNAVRGATFIVPASEFVPSIVEAEPMYHKVAQKWSKHLTVGEHTGRWEIAFVLTVLITRVDGVTTKRVFSFDPEGEVGAGVSPDVEQCNPNGFDEVACMPEGEVGAGVSPT